MDSLQVDEYKSFINQIKLKVQSSQIKAHIKVNVEMLKLYWDLASMIVEKQKLSAWGDQLISNISKDLKKEFPNMEGFSVRNLKYMKQWHLFWEKEKGQQVVAQIFQIPWGHNILIITKCKTVNEAQFYLNEIIENNHSRASLLKEMQSNLYQRKDKVMTNFESNLPKEQSTLAIQTLKDPYNFDFLSLTQQHNEKELENALVDNVTDFLLELGQGFAFIGQQYKINIDGNEFKIDLLFYHVKLHSYIVVELKTTDFKPEFAGKLNFYVSAVDGEIKGVDDNPTIGILICKSKNNTIVEYALKDINKPIGVSQYQLTNILPTNLQSSLPSIEQIQTELQLMDIKE
jgi:predicted nuclease of restriction endonuclease-like (RecB) superfamily